jgi:hypothetical protein
MDNTSKAEYRLAQMLKLPIWLFSISFVTGTVILLLNLFGDGELRELTFPIGLLYVLTAVFTNASVFAALVICSFIFKEYQNKILQQACILLVNIPVAILYAYLAFNDPFGLSNHY